MGGTEATMYESELLSLLGYYQKRLDDIIEEHPAYDDIVWTRGTIQWIKNKLKEDYPHYYYDDYDFDD